jgi:peptidoglycan/LPS O-acetylase OafA/YrhL
MTTFGYSVLALFYTACLLLAVSTPGGSGMLRNRTLMGLGALAYCTYLIHFPLIMAGRRLVALRLSHDQARLPGAILGIALALPIAMLSWKYFEKPMLRRGHKYVY